ncbi:hypothetical protein NXV08_11145 [Bacteroides fragilis]|nr:hypothetical protein [Bacteroides fragilis]
MKMNPFNNSRSNSSPRFRRGVGGGASFSSSSCFSSPRVTTWKTRILLRAVATVCLSKPEQPNSTFSAKGSST